MGGATALPPALGCPTRVELMSRHHLPGPVLRLTQGRVALGLALTLSSWGWFVCWARGPSPTLTLAERVAGSGGRGMATAGEHERTGRGSWQDGHGTGVGRDLWDPGGRCPADTPRPQHPHSAPLRPT